MDYSARMYDPALGRFREASRAQRVDTSADTPSTSSGQRIIPSTQGVQGWDRYAYVNNNPVRYTDPSGHIMCAEVEVCNPGSGTQVGGGSGSIGSGGGGSGSSDGGNNNDCGYHLCSDTNLYEVGWENFDQAWDIYWNPNATSEQRWLAGAYIGAWGGAHVCIVICTGVAAAEFLVPGLISCIANPACQAKLWQGSGPYPGVDSWKNVVLPKGSTVWGGAPGQSSFYTNSQTIQIAGNNATKIFQGLQTSIGNYSAYRPGMTQYIVTQEIQVAQSVALANPQHGLGGFTQYFIPDFNQVLQPVFTLLLTNK